MGWPFLFNTKALRLRVDLGLLKVSLAFAKFIYPLYIKEIAERMALDLHDLSFPYVT